MIDLYQNGRFEALIVPLLEARRTKNLALGKGPTIIFLICLSANQCGFF